MKLGPMLVLLYILMISIMIFDNVAQDTYDLNPYNYTNQSNQSALWDLFFNPTQWSNNLLTIVFGSIAAIGITLTITYITKSDISLLSPIFVLIFGAGIVPIVSFYNVINRELMALFVSAGSCTATSICTPSLLITSIIIGPLAVYWVMVCLEWWTARQTS